ncbi:MAG: LysR family transcriptional regulator [Parvibaculum sp.]
MRQFYGLNIFNYSLNDMTNLPSTQVLEAFEAAGRHLSFLAAAQELNVTASAISHRIKNLEHFCGAPLFVRHTRHVTLTKLGARMLTKARAVIDEINTFRSEGNDLRLKIGVTPLFGTSLLLPNLDTYYKQKQSVRLELALALTHLPQSQFHAIVQYGHARRPGWLLRPLMTVRLLAVCAPSVMREDISDLFRTTPRIDYNYARNTWSLLPRSLARLSGNSVTVSSMVDAITAAKAGQGLAVVVAELALRELEEGSLVPVPQIRSKSGQFSLLYREEIQHTPAFLGFSRWLDRCCHTTSR